MVVEASELKRALIITYVFAPVGYVGTFRTLKYCKFMPELGWEPIVLTIDPKKVAHQDDRLLSQLPPGIKIYRTRDVDPGRWLRDRGMRKIRAAERRSNDSRRDHSTTSTMVSNGRAEAHSLWKRFKMLINAILTDSPDSHIFWIPFAVLRGLRVLRHERIDVIYCSSPPHSSHVIAYLLGKISGRPYVLDFRDPWITDKQGRIPRLYYRLLSAVERRIKRAVVGSAAKIICATPGERDDLRAEFPEIEESRFTYITNGFDPSDFAGLRPSARPGSKLVLTHSGTIYPGIADELFSALAHLLESSPGIEQKLEVNLVGDIMYTYEPTIKELSRAGIVRAHGLKPHAETLQLLLDSDVLLILRGGMHFRPSHIPAKIFEYMYVAKPMLVIAADGELVRVARNSGLGIVVAPNNAIALANEILELCRRHSNGGLSMSPNLPYIDTFHRRSLAASLVQNLSEVHRGAVFAV